MTRFLTVNGTVKRLSSLPIFMQNQSGGDSLALGVDAPHASTPHLCLPSPPGTSVHAIVFPESEPVWPNGKALGLVSGRTSVRYRFGSPFSSQRLRFVDTVL